MTLGKGLGRQVDLPPISCKHLQFEKCFDRRCERLCKRRFDIFQLPHLENAVDLVERRQIRAALRDVRNSTLKTVTNSRRKSSVHSPAGFNNNNRRGSVSTQNKRDFVAENKQRAGRRESVSGRRSSVVQGAGGRRPSTTTPGRRQSTSNGSGQRRASVVNSNNNNRRQSVAKKQVSEVKLFLSPAPNEQRRKSQSGNLTPRRPSVANNASARRLSVTNGNKTGRKESTAGLNNGGRRLSTTHSPNRRLSKVGLDRKKSISVQDIDKIEDVDVLRQMLAENTKAEERVRIQQAIKALDPPTTVSLIDHSMFLVPRIVDNRWVNDLEWCLLSLNNSREHLDGVIEHVTEAEEIADSVLW
ncbi:hypothetical protein CAPTEDRAFT_208821 [Capitella teleta]|uniref:Uncharacterized protein n=1 Tax=Capitella teleta TaxID=283909 RepID=R7UF35_CAPTE|nr:hypothetical protein CAPTEDRAFT_208821 [Capitella teleta]|eukprot:ELU02398.1 hypothetical protein CAPTEDRAFT_208821 [Capitella teleta]